MIAAAVKRRTFITLLGGAAAAWPLAARAQQGGRLPTIGLLGVGTAAGWVYFTGAFVQRLRELGWIEGRTVAIEYRWAEGRRERFSEIAAEFVRLKVDVIVTGGDAAGAAKQVTSAIPIVFALGLDPLGSGLVADLARPGGNVTGLSFQSVDIAGKHYIRIPAVRGYRARLRRAQWSCGRNLCLRRRPCLHQPESNQYLVGRFATADGSSCPRVYRSGRPGVLWAKHAGPVPARGRVCRYDFARGEAGRYLRGAADQVRTRHQLDDREGDRPHHPAHAARPRRRGDRIAGRWAQNKEDRLPEM